MTEEPALAKGTLFKAVKKAENGQYLLTLTVGCRPLDAVGLSMSHMTISELTSLVEAFYGAGNVVVLDTSRGETSGVPCIHLLLDLRPYPTVQLVSCETYLIRDRNLYTIAFWCSKRLYPERAAQMKQCAGSLVFLGLTSTEKHPGDTPQLDPRGVHVVVTSGEKPLQATVKALGRELFRNVALAVLFTLGAIAWGLLRARRKTGSRPTSEKAGREADLHPMNLDSPDDWYAKGNQFCERGKTTEALACYDKAIGFKPDDPDGHYGRSLALDDLGRKQDAIASYRRYLEIASADDEERIQYSRGRLELLTRG
jgi:hypothetical protein